MTDDELVKAVLEKLGWTGVFQNDAGEWEGYAPYPTPPPTMSYDDWFTAGPGNYLTACPDYLTDRNAVAELVGRFEGDAGRKLMYQVHLEKIVFDGVMPDTNTRKYFWGITNATLTQQLRAWWDVMKDE